jgi:hypothetical protein
VNRYVFICVSLAIICAALFVADTNGVFQKAPHPIAYISESTRTVRRLPNNELTWDRAREGTPLELGDTLSTGYRAQAKIVFKAGGILTLDEGSMVVLSGNLEELQLNFVTGGAHLQVTQEAKTKIKVTQPKAPAAPKAVAQIHKMREAVQVSMLEDSSLLELSPPESAPKKIEFKEVLPGMIQKSAIDPAEEAPAQSFEIQKGAAVLWLNSLPQETYLYGTPKPTVKASWKLDAPSPKKSYFRVTFIEDGSDTKVTSKTQKLNVEQIVPHDGIYDEQVDLVSAEDVVLSTTPPRKVVVKVAPLLPPPKFSSRLPASLGASRSGSILLNWNEVPTATAYVIQVKDSKNNNFSTEKRNSTSGGVKGLLPGEYKVRLATIDSYNRMGAFGEEKVITVPSLSDVKSPTFKRFEIK